MYSRLFILLLQSISSVDLILFQTPALFAIVSFRTHRLTIPPYMEGQNMSTLNATKKVCDSKQIN